jgi:hypothetical protein
MAKAEVVPNKELLEAAAEQEQRADRLALQAAANRFLAAQGEIQLTLTREEAGTLTDILGMIGGDASISRRGIASGIGSALCRLFPGRRLGIADDIVSSLNFRPRRPGDVVTR